MAFAALPDTVTERDFRDDSACYETELLQWLSSRERQSEPVEASDSPSAR